MDKQIFSRVDNSDEIAGAYRAGREEVIYAINELLQDEPERMNPEAGYRNDLRKTLRHQITQLGGENEN